MHRQPLAGPVQGFHVIGGLTARQAEVKLQGVFI